MVGDPLTNWRFVPVVEKLRLTISSPSHGSMPASLSCGFSLSSSAPVNTASTAQTSAPVRINDLSVRSPSKQLQGADDDRLACARLPGDGGESRAELPFEILNQRQILDSEQGQNGGHGEEVES